MKLLLFLSNYFVATIYCANILVVLEIGGVSHMSILKNIAKGLAEKGHNIDMVSQFPLEKPLERYTDINIGNKSTILTNQFFLNDMKSLTIKSTIMTVIEKVSLPACKSAFENPKLQQLKKTKKKYDLLIVELFMSDCMLGWGWYFDVPTILVSSSYPLPSRVDRFGLPESTGYITTYFARGFSTEMSLFERFVNTWKYIQTKYFINSYNQIIDEITRDFFGLEMPSLSDLAYNSSLLLVNTHFSIHFARPLVPNVVEVAGLHIEEPQPLNQYYDNLLGNDTKGVIYFSMGSLLAIESFSIDLLQDILDVFAPLPYKVIWRAKQEALPRNLNVSKNVYFENWVPQLDLLCDSRVKLFISHGGMMSTQEAIYCAVPILGVPIFADQFLNIKQVQNSGNGLMIKDLTKRELIKSIKELLHDSKYSKSAKEVSKLFKDRPMSAKETAIYWIEYVLRHKGAPKLQSFAKQLAWYQYYLLDLITIIVCTLSTIILLLVLFIKCIFLSKEIKLKHL
ncbi:unnamed protein product [Ceutorhynchus assimilis]|uniref:UDP-glucuronosyltransferase n=1 Tax=Ceutorhynchus assimilis TaxID=467358 RepID=A0A9N9QNN4_9CUCU|nr:unnamed protein product [Ceutorhynchus assimilis]